MLAFYGRTNNTFFIDVKNYFTENKIENDPNKIKELSTEFVGACTFILAKTSIFKLLNIFKLFAKVFALLKVPVQ